MHTSAFNTCRIHHNGDYDGDIYITNEDSTSKPIGEKTTVELDFKDAVKCYRDNRKKNPKTVVFKGRSDEGKKSEITVAFKDIVSFVSCVLEDRCMAKIESGNLKMGQLIGLARVLKVKINPDILKEEDCPFCVGRTGVVCATCEDCGGSGKL
jgi:hypothetical protein